MSAILSKGQLIKTIRNVTHYLIGAIILTRYS